VIRSRFELFTKSRAHTRPIAIKVEGDPNSANNGIFYIHTDHLGSTTVLGKGSASTPFPGSLTRYYPFGGYRTSPSQSVTDRGYTGHRHNDDLGLIYMNARYYLPYINRFISADTIVPDPANPQSFNRYSYSLNNPIKNTDPTGHYAVNQEGGRTCEESHGCPQHYVHAQPFTPDYPEDPRRFELISLGCLGSRCRVIPSIVPIYLAQEGTQPRVARSPEWQIVGESLDAAGAAIDIAATGVSSSFVGAQVVTALLGGPGLDDAAVAGSYYLADRYIEDPLSRVGAGVIIAGDFASGESNLSSNRIILGQDSTVLGVTTLLGEFAGDVPFAGPTLDTVINLAVNVYDIGRLSGDIPTVVDFRGDSSGFYTMFYQP
jgi:RHS repeat-associated protein